jgi:broad specificity phosphatase PhoE
MKWPSELILVRHDVSKYNILKHKKAEDELYKRFVASFEQRPDGAMTQELAKLVEEKFAMGVSDFETSLVDPDSPDAQKVGKVLSEQFALPDIIFVSPFLRTRQTLQGLIKGWPELENVKIVLEERLREQSHGLSSLYNDWRIFQALHPPQKQLYDLDGIYWYCYPQGENVPMVRERIRSWLSTLTRDFSGYRVLAVTHHLSILSVRANLERLDAQEFVRLDQEEKPINLGVTLYSGHADKGKDGKLVLDYYNKQLH